MKQITGVYPPIPTPFKGSEAVDYEGLKHNIDRWNREPLDGYVVMGSNSESVHLSLDEKIKITAIARASASSERKVIAGSGDQSTLATIETTQKLADAGADAALVITPSFYKNQMNEDALFAHFTKVATRAPIPILLYNVPAYTGLDMPSELIVRLAEHPNIVGVKESSGHMGKAASIIAAAPGDFSFLTGTANSLLGALSLGASGGIMALANIAAVAIKKLIDAFNEGNLSQAAELQRTLVPVNMAITAEFGVPGLKAAMEETGRCGGPPRLPLSSLNESGRARIQTILDAAGLL